MTSPRYDIVTEYLSAFSHEIELQAKQKGIFLKPLKDRDVHKEMFEKIMNKLDCKMIVFNGHGSEDSIKGHKDEILVKAGENEDILKNRIVYARSCEAAATLGATCAKNTEGCFIGYTLPFEFYFNAEWMGNPIKDNVAKLFLESSNLVPLSIIKGNNSGVSHERAKNQMLKNIKNILKSNTKESFSIAESLWNNYLGQVLIGNQDAKL